MTELADNAQAADQQTQQPNEAPAKPTLEDTLAALDPEARDFVLSQVKSARTEAKNLRERLRDTETQWTQRWQEAEPKISDYDRLIEASKSDEERKSEELQRKAEEAARWQTEAEKWRTASVSSRIHALAAQDFADPEDAIAALAQPGKYLDAGGTIDDKAIKADLAELLNRKPHFRRAEEAQRPRVPAPNAHQGSGAGGAQKLDPRQEFAALLQAGLNR